MEGAEEDGAVGMRLSASCAAPVCLQVIGCTPDLEHRLVFRGRTREWCSIPRRETSLGLPELGTVNLTKVYWDGGFTCVYCSRATTKAASSD
jgi:hypothetical protein